VVLSRVWWSPIPVSVRKHRLQALLAAPVYGGKGRADCTSARGEFSPMANHEQARIAALSGNSRSSEPSPVSHSSTWPANPYRGASLTAAFQPGRSLVLRVRACSPHRHPSLQTRQPIRCVQSVPTAAAVKASSLATTKGVRQYHWVPKKLLWDREELLRNRLLLGPYINPPLMGWESRGCGHCCQLKTMPWVV
jgi:hypothetical protein